VTSISFVATIDRVERFAHAKQVRERRLSPTSSVSGLRAALYR
jgi:hypothetical protein